MALCVLLQCGRAGCELLACAGPVACLIAPCLHAPQTRLAAEGLVILVIQSADHGDLVLCRPVQVAVGTWAVVTLGLAVAAAVQGRASMPRLLPDFEAFSGGAAQVCAIWGGQQWRAVPSKGCPEWHRAVALWSSRHLRC